MPSSEVKDNTGAKLRYQYNVCNQLVEEERRINIKTVQRKGYIYDAMGQVTAITEHKKGSRNDETEERKVRMAITRFYYDKNGNLTKLVIPKGNEIRRTYAAANQLIEEEHLERGDGIHNKVRFRYDQAGGASI